MSRLCIEGSLFLWSVNAVSSAKCGNHTLLSSSNLTCKYQQFSESFTFCRNIFTCRDGKFDTVKFLYIILSYVFFEQIYHSLLKLGFCSKTAITSGTIVLRCKWISDHRVISEM